MTETLRWRTHSFTDLSNLELYEIYKQRQAVFVVEQNCVYQDLDGLDSSARHLCGWQSESETPRLLAYLRILPPGSKYTEPSIGRLLTCSEERGVGLGQELLRRGLIESARLYPGQGNRISAQAYLEKFYQGFGFVCLSDPYLEDDIPHIDMVLKN